MSSSERASRMGSRAACAAATALGWGCANELPPPGARPDQLPPTIERITPAPDSIVPGFDGKIEIRFDEPVNVPQDLARRMLASPFENYDMETGFSSIKLEPRGGWRDSVVYCLEIPAGITDLLRNRTTDPTGFCFSTGVPIADTEIRGTVFDAVTGQTLADASVLFMAPPDSTPYGAVTGQDGRFRLRALPPGPYEAFGFADQNRNLALDRVIEPHDSTTFTIIEGARPDLEFRLVAPDTTPPALVRAEAVDELTLRLEFDDALTRPQPGAPEVTVRDSASDAEIEVWAVRVGEPATVRFPVDSAALGQDTTGAVPPDSARADPADSAGVVPPGPVAEPGGGAPELPSRFVSVRLRAPIVSGTYRVSAAGFVNLRHLTGGGDTTFVADIAPPDSAGAAVDTTGAVIDTTGAVIDTTGAVIDTTGAVIDTAGAIDTLPGATARNRVFGENRATSRRFSLGDLLARRPRAASRDAMRPLRGPPCAFRAARSGGGASR